MKRIEQSVLLAGLLAMALAGCSSTGTSGSDSGTTASSSDTTSQPSSSYGSTAGSSTTASGSAGEAMPGSATGATTAAPNSTVTSIEVVQRQPDSAATSGSTSVGGSNTAGSTGAAGDRMYRITLRMDDGTTKVVTQEWAPSFSTGDRVRMSSGVIQR